MYGFLSNAGIEVMNLVFAYEWGYLDLVELRGRGTRAEFAIFERGNWSLHHRRGEVPCVSLSQQTAGESDILQHRLGYIHSAEGRTRSD